MNETKPADIISDVNANDPVDQLYAELCRRTERGLNLLSAADLHHLCDCADAIAGIHSKRSADSTLGSMAATLAPLMGQLKKPSGHE